MWECIVNAWAWLGSNSGQVQTFIGIIALGFAVLGYFKVLKQIKISNQQTNLAVRQEELSLNLNIINMTNQNIEKIGKMLIQLSLLQKELESIYQKLLNIGDPYASIIKKNMDSLEGQRIELENNRKLLAELAEASLMGSKGNHKNRIDHLNTLNKILIVSSNHVIEYHLMIHDIEGIKKEKNLE